MCHIYLQMSETREHAVTKERSSQSKILNLETQLSRTTSEINQLRRSKEEVKASIKSLLKMCTHQLISRSIRCVFMMPRWSGDTRAEGRT